MTAKYKLQEGRLAIDSFGDKLNQSYTGGPMIRASLKCEGNLHPVHLKYGLATMLLIAVAFAASSSFVEAKSVSQKENKRELLKPAEIAQMESRVLHLTNVERVRKGLKELKSSQALVYVAREQTKHMCGSQILTHESDTFPEGWRKLIERMKIVNVKSGGENVALRTVQSDLDDWAGKIVQGWMKSPPHKKNILEPSFRYIGIAVEPCEKKIAYVTQMFSSEMGTLPRKSPGFKSSVMSK
jgi:uncharacterized protein YkwD